MDNKRRRIKQEFEKLRSILINLVDYESGKALNRYSNFDFTQLGLHFKKLIRDIEMNGDVFIKELSSEEEMKFLYPQAYKYMGVCLSVSNFEIIKQIVLKYYSEEDVNEILEQFNMER